MLRQVRRGPRPGAGPGSGPRAWECGGGPGAGPGLRPGAAASGHRGCEMERWAVSAVLGLQPPGLCCPARWGRGTRQEPLGSDPVAIRSRGERGRTGRADAVQCCP